MAGRNVTAERRSATRRRTLSRPFATAERTVRVSPPSEAVPGGWDPATRARFVVSVVGVRGAARLLKVAPSQPSRWASAEEVPSPEVARRLLDLDHVLAQLVQVWAPEVASDWLESANPMLGGATPLQVLEVRGSAEVAEALRAEAQGAFS